MSILFLILPLTIIVAGASVVAYVWSARAGQFDDLDTPAVRMLYDDEVTTSPPPGSDATGASVHRSSAALPRVP